MGYLGLCLLGSLGFEYWVLEVASGNENRIRFPVGDHFAFETHGENWNEGNQMKLSRFKQVDFVKYAYPSL